MRRRSVLLAQILAFGLFLLEASHASGEPFLDIYGGIGQTGSEQVTAAHRDCTSIVFGFCSPETKATRKARFEASPTYGVRAGYWFETVPWLGLAGDVSHFEANDDDARFRVIPFSVLVMARWPLLATEEIPKGRLQPYVGLGPSIIYQEARVDYRPEVSNNVRVDSVHVGLDVRAGVTWQFHPRVGLFAEYRFSHVSIVADNDSEFFSVRTERVDATLNTNHILAGISIRF